MAPSHCCFPRGAFPKVFFWSGCDFCPAGAASGGGGSTSWADGEEGVHLCYVIWMTDECVTVIVSCSLSLCVFWTAVLSCLVWNVLSAS